MLLLKADIIADVDDFTYYVTLCAQTTSTVDTIAFG